MDENESIEPITCPATGLLMPLDVRVFADRALPARTTIASGPCPHCGAMHVWRKEDRWIVHELTPQHLRSPARTASSVPSETPAER